MSDKTAIEWADASWNPVTGCTEVSPGCDHCYAKTFAERWRGTPGHHYERGFDLTLRPERLDQPLRWRRPRRIFVNSMSDLFHESVPDGFIARVWDVMAHCPQHTFQILTKRHARMRSWVKRWADHAEEGPPRLVRGPEATRAAHPSGRGQLFADMLEQMGTPPEGCAYPTYDWMEGQRWWPAVLPNVWLGVSVEDQKWADIRVPALLDTPAAVRWLSCEPLLGPIDLRHDGWLLTTVESCTCDGGVYTRHHPYCGAEPGGIDWVVVGGESGRDARPMHPDWARTLRDQCTAAGVPFFFKQHGEWFPIGPLYDLEEEGDSEDARWDAVDIEVIDKKRVVELERDGYIVEGHQPNDPRTWLMGRLGKRAAGRELDGRTWDEYPAVAQ